MSKTSLVRSWKPAGTSPGNGVLLVESGEERIAMDYGNKLKIFWDRDPKWHGKPPFPHQYKKQESFKEND